MSEATVRKRINLEAVTISDVAIHADVSRATVSRVLNGGYPVSLPKRLRVQQAVRELSYVRNAQARALRAGSTGVVGVIVHDVSDPFFADIVAGIQEVAAAHRLLVTVCNSLRVLADELEYIQMLRSQRVDAIILAGGAIDDSAYVRELGRQARFLERQGARMVLCGGHHPISADAVLPDNRGGARILTEHVIQAGHTRIAEVQGLPNFSTTQDRSAGHRDALQAAGLEADPKLAVSGGFTRDGGYEAMRQLLRRRDDFTAVFAANDLMAVGALAAMREAGVKVPDDVSLVGFDDLPIARDVLPAITTVRVPMREMGRRCMTAALARPPRLRIEILPVQLVVRDSVGPPRGLPVGLS